MTSQVNFQDLRTSWTKYDIVRVMEVIENLEILYKFKNREAGIDEPILRSFLGIKSLDDPLPEYWIQIQNYPKEKKLFALFATIFTHGEIVNEFATKYATGDMKGIFITDYGKQYTNIRSALIESDAALPIYRRTERVPYDFSPIYQNAEVGKLFKLVLLERISRLTREKLTDSVFYEICSTNKFHSALSITEEQFFNWTQGEAVVESNFIQKIQISNFFSVENAVLDFGNAKEIYFLGENGDGKSLILMGIYLAFNSNYIVERTDQERTGKVTDIIKSNKTLQLLGIDDQGNQYTLSKSIYLNNLYAYGTHRGRYSTDKSEVYGFMSLFDSEETLLNPISWLKDQKLLELEKNLDSKNVSDELKSLPNSFPVATLEIMFYELLEKHVEVKFEGSDVLFKEKGTYLTFDQLSEGYKTILIFISDLLFRLNENVKERKTMLDLKGIVLVDEIDLHLHPKWQRVIVNKLRKLLPNVQFIFTTHSPTILQGASEDAIIYRVYRNTEDGKTKVSEPYYRKELDHLMINTILTSPLFGLEDSRMNSEDENSDTSKTYLLYRINKMLQEELATQKAEGKQFIKDEEIDDLIQKIMDQELGKE